MRRSLVIAAMAASFCCACRLTPDEKPSTVTVPDLTVAATPDWTGAIEGEPAVALVNGIPIPAGRLERALDQDSTSDPRDVLARLIDAELAAQDVFRKPATPGIDDTPDAVVPTVTRVVYEKALARALINDRFLEGMPIDETPREYIEELWMHPGIRGRFVHLDLYSIQDYQWICCDGNPRTCAAPEVQQCFQEGEPAMKALHDLIMKDPPDFQDMPFLVERYQSAAPRLSHQAYDFAYDANQKVQKGAILFADAVVNKVVSAPVGRYLSPVRSTFGWHILYVTSHLPQSTRTLDDPEVRREIATTFRARIQQMRWLETLATLIPVDRMAVLRGYFEKRPRPPGRALFDVEVFAQALRDAVEYQEADHEDSLL